MARKEYLCVGKIVGSRGLKGEVKVLHYCDGFDVFLGIKNFFTDTIDKNFLSIKDIRVHKQHILLRLNDVNTKTDAEKLRNNYLYAFREDIPIEPESYFIEELKNCDIYNFKTHKFYGTLKDVLNTGANDIYEIYNPEEKKEYLVPIIKNTVVNIDLDENKIFINPVEGIFDE